MLIELVLTIFAWRKGWGPIALLPLAVGVTVGVIFSGVDHSLAPAVMADILIYATLITMIAVGRKPSAQGTAIPPAAVPSDVTRQTAA
jgi:hypothetical protein